MTSVRHTLSSPPGQGDLFSSKVRRRHYLPVLTSPPMAPPRARKGNPPTSHDAARRVAEVVELQRALILGAVEGQGVQGMNASEVDDKLEFPVGTAGRRLGELADDHYLARTKVKRPTTSGCWGLVFVGMRPYHEFGLEELTRKLLENREARLVESPAPAAPGGSGSPNTVRDG